MLYRIGEAAEILGMTKEGVRFLERKGLLHSVRDENNGYRYYNRGSLTIVQQVRGYSALGFTLEEAADLVLQRDEGHILSALEERDKLMEEEIKALVGKRALLQSQRELVQRAYSCREERSIRAIRPAYYLPLEGERVAESGSWLREAEKRWMMAAPPVMLAKQPLDKDGNLLKSKGMCVSAAEAERLGLPLRGAVYQGEELCLIANICNPIGEVEGFRELYDWVCSRGWVPTGDMTSAVQIPTIRGGKRCNLNIVYMPVKEGGK